MITCHRFNLEARCGERGYTLDEVMGCVVAQDGDMWTIDTESQFYPRLPKASHQNKAAASIRGPGAELKKLLAGWPFYIKATPTCPCNARAAIMDANEAREPGWCAAHIDEIVGWLREQAQARGLPFMDAAGRALVRRAIRNFQRS